MDNKENINEEKDVLIYDSSNKRPVRARRDIGQDKSDKREDNDKTRVDMPTLTDEIIAPVRRATRDVPKSEKAPEEKKTSTAPDKNEPSPREKDGEKKSTVPEKIFLEDEEENTESDGKKVFSALGKSVIYIIFVLCASVIIAYFGITVSNDVFAFVKDGKTVTVEVTEDMTFRELASILKDEGVVKYPLFLRLYNSFKNRNNDEEQKLDVKVHTITANLNYDEIISAFTKKTPKRSIVRITFKEGMTADEVIDLFLENGIGTREGFVAAISDANLYDMDYRFLNELKELQAQGFEEGRKYALEGYLFPDTYDFYTDSSEVQAIAKLLDTFNVRFDDAYYLRCDELGMTVDEVITVASIVQMETKLDSEMSTVSSVYHNRLNNSASYPRLECDSTYLYAFPERRGEVTLDEMKASPNPYSTYSHDGLPPSAICSPSLNAIIAGLYPEDYKYKTDTNGLIVTDSDGNPVETEPVKCYFMYAHPNGHHLFARTKAEHEANIATVERYKQKEAS